MKKIKLTKKQNKDLTKIVIFLTMFSFIGGLCFGTYTAVIGFHNTDLGQNIRYLNAEYDLDLIDITNENTKVTGETLLSTGYFQIKGGVVLMGYCLFMLGFYSYGLIDKYEVNKNE